MWPGFSFALHPLRVQGFYFALLQCIHIQAFTASFAPSMQLYRTCRKTAHRALQRLFLRFAPFNRPQYQTGKSGYNAACATLEHITAPQHLQRIPKYKRHARTLCNSAQPPYYNKVYKGAAYRRPCKSGGVSVSTCTGSARRGLDASHAQRLEVWHRVSGKPSTLHPAGQSSSGRRGTIGGYRHISFRAFAR